MVLDISKGAYGVDNVGEITSGITVYQVIECPSEYLHALEVKAATFDRENDCTVTLELVDFKNPLITYEKREIDAKTLSDGDPLVLEIQNPELLTYLKGMDLMLEIYSTDATEGNAISVYCTTNDNYIGNMQVAKDRQERDLQLKVYGNNKPVNYDSVRAWMCVYTAAVACVFVWVLLRKKKAGNGKEEEA